MAIDWRDELNYPWEKIDGCNDGTPLAWIGDDDWQAYIFQTPEERYHAEWWELNTGDGPSDRFETPEEAEDWLIGELRIFRTRMREACGCIDTLLGEQDAEVSPDAKHLGDDIPPPFAKEQPVTQKEIHRAAVQARGLVDPHGHFDEDE